MNRHQETGSAHVIIIVVLVVALLGTLGFVLWQNLINKPATTATTATTTNSSNSSDNKTTTPTTPAAKTGLVITSWNINIPVTGSYAYTQTDTTHAKITSDALTKAETAAGCNEDNGITVYQTATTTDSMPGTPTSPQIDGKYYQLMRGSQALCVGYGSGKGTDSGDKATNDAYEVLYNDLKAVWGSVSAS